MSGRIAIAIDGPSSAGKSTVAKAIAGRLNTLLKKKLAGSPAQDLQAFLLSLIYDPTPDDGVDMEL